MSKVIPQLVVLAEPLLDALSAVMPAAAKDVARPILSSVLFEVGTARKPSLKLVACDNYRIATAIVPMDPLNTDAAITGAAATFVMRLVDVKDLWLTLKGVTAKARNPIPVTFRWFPDGTITVAVAARIVTFRPADGAYPNYAAVLPKGKPAFTISVSATYLAELVKAATAGGKPANGHGGSGSDTVLIEVRKGLAGKLPGDRYVIRAYNDKVQSRMAVLMAVRTVEGAS